MRSIISWAIRQTPAMNTIMAAILITESFFLKSRPSASEPVHSHVGSSSSRSIQRVDKYER